MSTAFPALPPGIRIYAIGDIHGRLDLLTRLLAQIDADVRDSDATIQKIFLGDYIDRGLHSREIINFFLGQRQPPGEESPIFLFGNHELIMRAVVEQKDLTHFNNWLNFGGIETLLSYGFTPAELAKDRADIMDLAAQRIPKEHVGFLKNLQASASFGDYFFCHAGVNPAYSLGEQRVEDLAWIRRKFLDYTLPLEKMIVHGHTITSDVEFRPHRIGIDTGAYATGKLTALGLEGTRQWILQT